MKSASTFILVIYSYFVIETVILCDRNFKKRQTEPSSCPEESEYACQSGQCIDVASICDGIQDCSDGSDETEVLCESTTCPTYGFKCKYGACINIEGMCDGVTQCLDGSDEEQCSPQITSESGINSEITSSESISSESSTTESTTTESTTTESTTTESTTTESTTTESTTTESTTAASPTTAWKTTASPTAAWTTTAWKTTASPTIRSTTISSHHSSDQKKPCVIPSVEGTEHFYKDTIQNVSLSYGSVVDQYRIVEEDCKEGYYKTVPYKLMVCTESGQWKSFVSDALCLKKCPPMVSDVLDIKCSLNGNNANCSEPSEPGTILTQSCKVANSYNLPRGVMDTPNTELRCLQNAKWNGQLLTTCKKSISNRVKESSLIAPWNVEIYKINNYGRYFRICGGTLIAPNLVVTAAHCFWKKGLRRTILPNENNIFKTAVGKENSNFSLIDNTYTQIIDIKLIYLKESYDGASGMYADDISVIVLSKNIAISNGVWPASMDWSSTYSLSNGDLGMMYGLGMSTGQDKSILKLYYLPYVNRETCQEMYTNGFEDYVTKDKFCTGYKLVSGEKHLIGFGGSGLMYKYNTAHFLTGIFSVKDLHSNKSIAVFTSIEYHVQWIRNIYINHVSTV